MKNLITIDRNKINQLKQLTDEITNFLNDRKLIATELRLTTCLRENLIYRS